MSEELLRKQLEEVEGKRFKITRILCYLLVKYHSGKIEIPFEEIQYLNEGGVCVRNLGNSLMVSGYFSDEEINGNNNTNL